MPLQSHRVERAPNKSLRRQLTLEKNVLLLLLLGLKLTTFWSKVRRSTNKLSWLPCIYVLNNQLTHGRPGIGPFCAPASRPAAMLPPPLPSALRLVSSAGISEQHARSLGQSKRYPPLLCISLFFFSCSLPYFPLLDTNTVKSNISIYTDQKCFNTVSTMLTWFWPSFLLCVHIFIPFSFSIEHF